MDDKRFRALALGLGEMRRRLIGRGFEKMLNAYIGTNYRLVSQEVKAQQFDPSVKPWPDGVTAVGRPEYRVASAYVVKTLTGLVRVYSGDWVVREISGEIYVVSNMVFNESFEVLDG